jgi:hypothetical protein
MNQICITPVPFELLQAVASDAPAPIAPAPIALAPTKTTAAASAISANAYDSRLLVEKWLTDRAREFRVKPEPNSNGRTVYVLKVCPFDSSHADPDSCIMQGPDGALSAHCFHDSCRGKRWQDFKQAIGAPEAHHYDPPLAKRSKKLAECPTCVSALIPLPERDPLTLQVFSAAGKQQLIVATCGNIEHRDRLDTDRASSRDRFVAQIAAKLDMPAEVLFPLIENPMTKLASEANASGGADANDEDDWNKSQATLAVELAEDWELWHTASNDAYATIPVGGHKETWPVKSRTLKRYLNKIFFDATGKAMTSEAITGAGHLLEAKAIFNGDEHPVFVRVAGDDGNIYVDLCNDKWQVVEIKRDGWQVLDESPVRFRRSNGMRGLPTPLQGGSVDMLRPFVNVDEQNWVLIVAWLVGAFCPRGPYPILALFAEHGAGKSTGAGILRDLIDPNVSPLRSEPKDLRDMMIMANNLWCVAFDNLSYVPPWLSDSLCRLSTGGGFGTRELYENLDEITFDFQRPVMLNSIEEIATRSDLLDRCLITKLPAIDEKCRRPAAELLAEFQEIRPLVFGALLDAVSVAHRRLPTIKVTNLPRMADFAVWVTAAEPALGWVDGRFMEAYKKNRDNANEIALEALPVTAPLLDFLDYFRFWAGSASGLLAQLESRVSDQTKRMKAWPKAPRVMSMQLMRIAPNLRNIGWEVVQDRTAKERALIIRPCNDAKMRSSEPVASQIASSAQ